MLRFFVAGATLCVAAALVVWSFSIGPSTYWGSTLLNLGTELGGIVITVAVIEALFERNQQKREVRNNVARNVNFLLGICREGPPQFHYFNRLRLEAEIGFFQEIRELRHDLFRRSFSSLEIGLANRAYLMAESLLDTAKDAAGALEEAGQIRPQLLQLNPASPVCVLALAFDAYRVGPGPDALTLLAAVDRCCETNGSETLDSEVRALTEAFANSLRSYLGALASFMRSLNQLDSDARELRKSVWASL